MEIKEIECKNCMTKSKLTDYVINPYIGCEHGCKYCYADFIRRFQGIKPLWGEFVYAKKNCAELLKKELEKNKPGHIWLSSVCDCYMPLEKEYKMTQKILQTIINSKDRDKFTIEILTKSSLVKRDFGLLKQLPVELGLSINNLNACIAKIIEPEASSPEERIETLKLAKEEGIRVFGFISPVLPGITNLEEIFKELSFCDYVWVELLNTRKPILNKFLPIIRKNFSDNIKDFEYAINNPEEYYTKVKEEAEILSKKYNLKIKDIVRH
jgi:DNA repair photolyase